MSDSWGALARDVRGHIASGYVASIEELNEILDRMAALRGQVRGARRLDVGVTVDGRETHKPDLRLASGVKSHLPRLSSSDGTGPSCRCGSRNTARIGDSALTRQCQSCGQTYAYRLKDGLLIPHSLETAMALDEAR